MSVWILSIPGIRVGVGLCIIFGCLTVQLCPDLFQRVSQFNSGLLERLLNRFDVSDRKFSAAGLFPPHYIHWNTNN